MSPIQGNAMSRSMLPTATLLLATACEPPAPLTEAEGEFIYSQMVDEVSRQLTGAQEGDVDVSEPCPVGGSWAMTGTVTGSSVDRSWDVDTSVESCGIGGIDGDGNSVSLIISGGPVSVFSPAPDDETPFSAEGTVNWSRESDGGAGSCIIVTAEAEGEYGGCLEDV